MRIKILKQTFYYLIFLINASSLFAQDSTSWQKDIECLMIKHSTLFIGADPRDLDSVLANKIHQEDFERVGFLSLTRGENLSSNKFEKSLNTIQRGIYETNKALTKVGIWYDNLYFTRAYDFLSNTNIDSIQIFEEKWNRSKLIGDIVWCIRTFQPDEIIISNKCDKLSGKYLYIKHMIDDACKQAADSSYPQQFDDSRYPWKGEVISTNQYAKRLENRISKSDPSHNFLRNFLDSVQLLSPIRMEAAQILYRFRCLMDSVGYQNRVWNDFKIKQVNRLLLKYSDVKISGAFNQRYLILGNPYVFDLRYSGDGGNLKLQRIRFGQLDTSITNAAKFFHITKQVKLSSQENISQPYWLSSPMATSGMYDIEMMTSLDDPINPNPFLATFLFEGRSPARPLEIDLPLYYEKRIDSATIDQTPLITIPGFLDIKPNIVLPHLLPERTSEKITVSLRSNIEEKNIPIQILLFQKGVRLKRSDVMVKSSDKIILVQKDTTTDLKIGKMLQWNFDIPLKSLNANLGSIGAEIIIKKSYPVKINSSLNHIAPDNMADIDFHFQPKITVLNKDTIFTDIHNKVIVLDDSISTPNISWITYAMSTMHIPFRDIKLLDKNLILDTLKLTNTIIANGSHNPQMDSILYQFVNEGGRLILFPSIYDSLPFFVNHTLRSDIQILHKQDSLYSHVSDTTQIWIYPNKIKPASFCLEDIVSTYSWCNKDSLANTEYPIYFKNRMTDESANEMHPLAVMHIGKGKVILCGFYMDNESLEKNFIYQLIANLITY